jgi:hypothetical protein
MVLMMNSRYCRVLPVMMLAALVTAASAVAQKLQTRAHGESVLTSRVELLNTD